MVSARTPISREVASGRLHLGGAASGVNVGDTERWLSALGGGLLALYGLTRRSPLGLGLAALGGALVYRGLSGHCPCYATFGTSSARPHSAAASVAAGSGVKLSRSISIDRPAAVLYRVWRNFETLPRFMRHLVSIDVHGNRSHWVARAPVGMSVSWDAEIINDEADRLIAWRSLAGSTVSCAGSVHFQNLADGRGTEVQVTLKYDPPGGKLGSWLAWLFGEEPGVQIDDDLRRFKQLMETGEIPTTEGQPSATSA